MFSPSISSDQEAHRLIYGIQLTIYEIRVSGAKLAVSGAKLAVRAGLNQVGALGPFSAAATVGTNQAGSPDSRIAGSNHVGATAVPSVRKCRQST